MSATSNKNARVCQRPPSTKTRMKWNEIPRMFISDRWALVGFLRDVSFFGVLPWKGIAGRRPDFNEKHHARTSKTFAAWCRGNVRECASKTNFEDWGYEVPLRGTSLTDCLSPSCVGLRPTCMVLQNKAGPSTRLTSSRSTLQLHGESGSGSRTAVFAVIAVHARAVSRVFCQKICNDIVLGPNPAGLMPISPIRPINANF